LQVHFIFNILLFNFITETAAFGIPLCHLIFSLPPSILDSVAESGPLALIMAPTRELALQIDVEIGKLLSGQKTVKTAAIVGGQPIQAQATVLRNGVHIVVGTPGRINDCIESSYLVLNQCSYIVRYCTLHARALLSE
jgi:ATP-dependent RNA helicase DDX23/PRP28